MDYHYNYGSRLSSKGKEICYTEAEALDLYEQLEDRGAEVSMDYQQYYDDNGTKMECWLVAWDY